MAIINHITYCCDKCGKNFEKRIRVRHSWPPIDRDNECEVKFNLCILNGINTTAPDLCPDCIKEILLGALANLDEQMPKENTILEFAKDMFYQYNRMKLDGKAPLEILTFATDFFKGLTDGSVRIDKPDDAKAAIREFAGSICARLSGMAAAGKTTDEMLDGIKAILSEAIAAQICRTDGEKLAEHFAEKDVNEIINDLQG